MSGKVFQKKDEHLRKPLFSDRKPKGAISNKTENLRKPLFFHRKPSDPPFGEYITFLNGERGTPLPPLENRGNESMSPAKYYKSFFS